MSYESILKNIFRFWNNIQKHDQQYLLANTSIKTFKKEQAVHNNQECSGLFIVTKGRLRLYMLSNEGKEVTLYRLSPSDICMLSASCVLQSITFDVYVDAEEESECIMINGSIFHELSEKYMEVKNFALEKAVQRFSDVMWIMQQIVFMSMDKRLALFLLDENHYVQGNTITLTHEQIARHLGTAREVVSRLLKHFASDGLIEVSRKGITIINKKKLWELAND